jgi:hypothetical protein
VISLLEVLVARAITHRAGDACGGATSVVCSVLAEGGPAVSTLVEQFPSAPRLEIQIRDNLESRTVPVSERQKQAGSKSLKRA